MLQAIGIFAIAPVFGAAAGLHIGGFPRLRAYGAQKSGGVAGTRADFHVVRMQQCAALIGPILLKLEDDLLNGQHEGVALLVGGDFLCLNSKTMTDFTRASSVEQPSGHSVLCPAQTTLGVPAHRLHYWEWIPQSGRPACQILFCVHGLSRQGLDFAALAEYLTAKHDILVIAPDVAGRGQSDWLDNSLHYHAGVYAADMQHLINELQSALPHPLPLTWLGTSMGGLIAMAALAANAQVCDKLILNDVAPRLEWDALARIGQYIGAEPHFASKQEGLDYCKTLSVSFGQLSADEWLRLNTPQLRQRCTGDACDLERPWHLHYDPKIAVLTKAVTPELVAQQEPLAWGLYDNLRQPTLLLRGENSDLISAATAAEMQARGPQAQLLTVPNCGHAPALQDLAQIQAIEAFLLEN